MRTWAWILVAIVGGYFVYGAWFAPEDDAPQEADGPPPVLEVPVAEEAAAPGARVEGAAPARSRMALDVPREGEQPLSAARSPQAEKLAAGREEALRRGDADGAQKLAEQILAQHPSSDAARWIRFDRGREFLRKYREAGRTTEGLPHARRALEELTPALFLSDARPDERRNLRAQLGRLARDVFFTRHIEGVDRVYQVKRGDRLALLCRKVFPKWGAKVSPGFVADVNHLASPRALRAGEPIRVPLGEPEIVIVKSRFRLYFLFSGCYVRDYPVGLGKEGSTPAARFTIDDLIKNPDWSPRSGVVYPFGDPRNILGTRWLGFKNSDAYRGFGIHGTSDPNSVGKQASSGCVRMLRADVEKLFDWTPRGARVTVLR